MRQPTPWYRTFKNAWFVELGGKQVRLTKGKDSEKEAFEVFYRLMAVRPENLPPTDKITVATLSDLFPDYSQKHHSPDTYSVYRHFLLERRLFPHVTRACQGVLFDALDTVVDLMRKSSTRTDCGRRST